MHSLPVLGILALLATAQGSRGNPAVERTVRAWETKTGVDVSESSENTLERELPELADQLTFALRFSSPDLTFLTRTLTDSYLFWARDRATARNQRLEALPQNSTNDEALRAFGIHVRRLAFGREFGRIEVTSSPSGAPITIDGRAMGRTENVFVASEGPHTVVVSPQGRSQCSRTITVREDETERVDCG